jgi:hypothetical protein
MSVNFVNPVYAKRGEAIPISEHIGGGIPFDGREVLMFDDQISLISGVFDLPMIGGEISDCEHQFQKLTGGPLVLKGEVRGAFVRSAQSGNYYQLQQFLGFEEGRNFDFHIERNQLDKWDWKGRLFDDVWIEHRTERGIESTSKPSRDNVFVLRTSSLQAFTDAIMRQGVDRTLGTSERNTLLTIIAALAKEAKINIEPPGKAAGFIEGLTNSMGAPVSKRAIEEHLKKIPNALETRMK